MHEVAVERKKLPFNRKKPLADPVSGRAAIYLHLLRKRISLKVNDNNDVICTWRVKRKIA